MAKEKLSTYSLFCRMYVTNHLKILNDGLSFTSPAGFGDKYKYSGKKDIERYINNCKKELKDHVDNNRVEIDITLEEAYDNAGLTDIHEIELRFKVE